MNERIILTEEKKQELAEDIRRNGGEVSDPDFNELEEYLASNPPSTEYLDN